LKSNQLQVIRENTIKHQLQHNSSED